MAIDTAERRKALSYVVIVSPGVTPNVLQDAEWRSEVGYGYPFGDVPVLPAFAVDHDRLIIKIDDLGLHLLAVDLSLSVSSSDLDRLNLENTDLGRKIVQAGVQLNIQEG